jgi:hypothetical protein
MKEKGNKPHTACQSKNCPICHTKTSPPVQELKREISELIQKSLELTTQDPAKAAQILSSWLTAADRPKTNKKKIA